VNSGARLRWSIGAAVSVHAALAWAATLRHSRIDGLESIPTTEMEVELESRSTDAPIVAAEPAPASVSQERTSRPEPRLSLARLPSRLESAAPNGAAEVPTVGGGSWTFSPTEPAAGGTPPSSAAFDDAVHAGVRAVVAERPPKTDPMKSILGGVSPHDIELGLVPGGELVNLTRDTVRTSTAPDIGHATLEFRLDGTGTVISARVLDASSDSARWAEAATDIVKAARARPSKMSRGAQGYLLKLEVTSAIRTASGRTPTDATLTKVWRAINDPVDAVIDGTVPAQRVVAARIVDVQVL
jgi:hypothetical protein